MLEIWLVCLKPLPALYQFINFMNGFKHQRYTTRLSAYLPHYFRMSKVIPNELFAPILKIFNAEYGVYLYTCETALIWITARERAHANACVCCYKYIWFYWRVGSDKGVSATKFIQRLFPSSFFSLIFVYALENLNCNLFLCCRALSLQYDIFISQTFHDL